MSEITQNFKNFYRIIFKDFSIENFLKIARALHISPKPSKTFLNCQNPLELFWKRQIALKTKFDKNSSRFQVAYG